MARRDKKAFLREQYKEIEETIEWERLDISSRQLEIPREHFPGGLEGKASACNAGDWGLIPGSGRSPGEGNGNPLQYSCLENPMDGGAS